MRARPLHPLLHALLLTLACGDPGGPRGATDAPTTSTGAAASGGASEGSSSGSGSGEPGSSSSGDPAPSCEPAPPSHGLVFDGGAAVRVGPFEHLGLGTFTLEAWVRRDARGEGVGTGKGGLRMAPIITKGRGEGGSEGSVTDVNYALGFFGDVLGADFEDMASGANHPIQGKTPIPLGSWHHVAATYDGATWRLYVDGVLDAEATVDAAPRSDSIQPLGLGVAYNSEGVAAGALVGALDEVRIYDRALSADEIAATRDSAIPSADGLVAHYHLDDPTRIVDELGAAPGTPEGSLAAGAGAVLGRGGAPRLGAPRALDGGADLRLLTIDVDDDEAEPLEVEFFYRALGPADDFTVVVLPDTQYYTRGANPPARPEPDDPSYFEAQTAWAWENRYTRNVIGLLTLGDLINDAEVPAQWKRASDALAILEDTRDPGFPDGLPYAATFGNHDQYPGGTADATAEANQHFGVDRFAGRAYYGGNYDGDNDESYIYLRAGDLTIVAVSFQYNPTPDPAVLQWARRLFLAHPRALGVVTTHHLVTSGGGLTLQGKAIHAALADVPNVRLMASGHVALAARRVDEYDGHVVHSMLTDYQHAEPDPNDPETPVVLEKAQTNGGFGYMRIWGFAPSRQELFVESYSPKRDAAYTDEENEFVLPLPLVGAGRSPFASLGIVAPQGGVAQLPLAVPEGAVIEWYAVARDCDHVAESELQLIDNRL